MAATRTVLMPQWAWVPLAVLVGSILLEGYSFRTAIKESNHTRGRQNWMQFIRTAKAPELPVVLLEDTAALAGLVFALFGVSMTLVSGNGHVGCGGDRADRPAAGVRRRGPGHGDEVPAAGRIGLGVRRARHRSGPGGPRR